MAVTKLATQVPTPRVVSSFIYAEDYDLVVSPPAINFVGLIESGSDDLTSINKNAAVALIASLYGGNTVGVVHGLALSAGSGLVCNVAVGGCVTDGFQQIKTATSIVVAANQTNYIWLKNDGTLESKITTTAPTTPGCFLGMAITDASSITSIDTSGVIYLRSGIPYRETADTGFPLDTPPSGWIGITKTSAGSFLWVGDTYYKLQRKASCDVEAKTADYSVLAGDIDKIFTNEGTTAKRTNTLPSAVAGLGPFTFVIQDSDGVRIQANTGDTIRVANTVSASAGYAEATTIGNCITLVAINATEWVAISYVGTWTVV